MAKKLTSDLRSIDIRRLARDGHLVAGNILSWEWRKNGEVVASITLAVGEDHTITFNYSNGHAHKRYTVNQCICLTTTPCHYGRSRQWFSCPHCGKRVAMLYLGKRVACRHCYGMSYPVQRESRSDREIRRLNAIRRRLGWQAGFLNGNGYKPKGMHWRTYYRLEAEHDRLAAFVLGGLGQRFGLHRRN